ncbi:MAG: MFS transporter [Janthinobacterium lividum]
MTDPRIEAKDVLRHPAFQLYWAARVLSSGASQVLAIAVGWQIYALTGSTLQLGLIGLAQFLPMVLMTLPAGHVADRLDRRRIAQACQAAAGFGMLLLSTASASGGVRPGLIYTVVALVGAARAFESPAFSALLPGLVSPALFPRAVALATSAGQTAFILGPAIGGLLYALGSVVPYGVAGIAALAASLCTGLIRNGPPPRREPATLRSVFSGIGFIARRPVILGAVSLDLFAVLFGGATALLPVYARDILHTGPWGLGLLRSAPAVGALALSVLLARYPLRRRVGRSMFGAVLVFGLATGVFAVSTSLPLSLSALLMLGASDVVSMVVRSSLVQLGTPDEMRGRVSAVNSLFIGTSNQLGEFESGSTAALLGTVPAVLLGGLGTIAVALLWMWLFPRLRKMDGFEAVQHEALSA